MRLLVLTSCCTLYPPSFNIPPLLAVAGPVDAYRYDTTMASLKMALSPYGTDGWYLVGNALRKGGLRFLPAGSTATGAISVSSRVPSDTMDLHGALLRNDELFLSMNDYVHQTSNIFRCDGLPSAPGPASCTSLLPDVRLKNVISDNEPEGYYTFVFESNARLWTVSTFTKTDETRRVVHTMLQLWERKGVGSAAWSIKSSVDLTEFTGGNKTDALRWAHYSLWGQYEAGKFVLFLAGRKSVSAPRLLLCDIQSQFHGCCALAPRSDN